LLPIFIQIGYMGLTVGGWCWKQTSVIVEWC